MKEQIVIRPVDASEVEILRTLGKSTFRETFQAQNDAESLAAYLRKSFTFEKVQEQLNSPSSNFYFALVDREIVGYLKLNLTDDQVEIERVYVRASFQGKNIGRVLIQKALAVAKSRKAAWLWLGVWQENKKAIAIYEHYGFVTFKTRQFQLGDELQDDFLMKLRIP